jgi:hypothetical protein
MAATWISIRVDLLCGAPCGELWPPPGRLRAVGPRHTFRDLAEAIDVAFGRWDRSHLWEFTLADGRRIGEPDPDDEPAEGEPELDDAGRLGVARTLEAGAEFRYLFDLGDHWVHRCAVVEERLDPSAVLGMVPDRPLPYAGWGALPDQYGLRWADDDGETPPPPQPADPDPMLARTWPRTPAGPVPLHGRDLRALRAATARRDRTAVRQLLEGRDPGPLLQHAGDALLAVGAAALADTARELQRLLRARDDEGDAELADALAAALGGPAPLLRPAVVDLDEVADLMSGDPAHDGGGWVDVQTGDTWPAENLESLDEDDRPDFDREPDRWLYVDCEGSRETWQDRYDFADGLRPGPLRERLLAALEGRGAFRRFASVLDGEPEILTEWRAFGAERGRGRARALLARNGYRPVAASGAA